MSNGRRQWRFHDGLLLAALVALAAVLTAGVWMEIFRIGWREEEQSHILLAPLIALWLVWVRRDRLRFCRPSWSIAGPAAIAVGWTMAVFGFTSSTDLARHLGVLITVLGAAMTIIGPATFMRFAPAVAALLFVLPIPGRIRLSIATPLQEWTAIATTWLMELFAMPVIRDGNVIRINDYPVAVAEACNGMRMVAALGLVSFAFVFSVPMRNSVRLAILAMSPLIALLVNIIRLVPTVLLYGYADLNAATVFHDISGWVMLLIALGILWGMLSLLRWLEIPIAPYSVAQE